MGVEPEVSPQSLATIFLVFLFSFFLFWGGEAGFLPKPGAH